MRQAEDGAGRAVGIAAAPKRVSVGVDVGGGHLFRLFRLFRLFSLLRTHRTGCLSCYLLGPAVGTAVGPAVGTAFPWSSTAFPWSSTAFHCLFSTVSHLSAHRLSLSRAGPAAGPAHQMHPVPAGGARRHPRPPGDSRNATETPPHHPVTTLRRYRLANRWTAL